MDSKTAGVNKADDQSSSIYDHRKRKKDEVMNDNCTKAALSRVELKWVQSEEDVSMTLVLNPEDGDAGNVEVVFTDREMTIIFANNFEQKWYFYDAVVKEKSKVQRKKKTFTIQVIKRVPGMWPSLEKTEPSNKQMESEFDVETIAAFDKENADGTHEKIIKEEEPVHNLQHVKHDFFEKDGNLTVHIYVKAVPKDSVRVRFESHCYFVKFQTGDSRFLQLHEGTSEDTVFSWKVTTKNAILPNACKFKITQSFIELTLRKATPERWATLEAPQRKDLPMSSKSTSWIPAKGASDKRDGVNTSSATTSSSIEVSGQASTLAFDEMAQVNLNHQDSGSPDLPHSTTQAGFQQNSTFKSQKPTCKVQPLNKLQGDVPVVNPGFTGLDNLGNTCFMNSVIQVLSNTREFRDFFLDERFIHEINKDNVLGTGGQLALAFGTLLKTLWSGTKYSCPPSKLKDLVAKKASQFTGYAQHDAQEFMAFLLDGLHEDLNRVKRKPYTETVDSDGRPDEVVANEAWEVYKKRNDSFVVDLFQGQYKSKLVCPVCNKVSITFDPFLYLSVPLPKKKKSILVTFMWRDPHRKPVKYLLQLVRDSSVDHLKELLSRKTGVQPSDIRVFEAYRGLFHKQFTSGSDLSGVQPNDTIIAAEVLSPETAGEEVVEIPIIQRTLIPHQFPTRCSSCHKDCESGSKLKRCTKCFKVGYCDQSCQRLHWQAHRPQCNPSPEPVGCPFYLSLPHSQSTYSRVAHLMESHARYSVDTFQPPVKADIPCVIISNTTSGGGLQLPSHPSGSNLSSSSGSQSSGSLSSLDSISSCSSTATLTADTNRATFEIDVEEDVEQREEIDEDGYAGAGENILECSMPLDEGGGGDVDSGVESVQSSQIRALSQSLDYAEGDMGEEEDKEVAQQLACAHQNPSSGFGSSIDSFSEEKQAPTNPVLGVQSAAPAERSIPLFFIKPVNSDGHGVRGSAGERLEDRGDSPLDLSSYEYLSMDWRNSDKLPSYVLVQSKSLESEMDPSSHSAIYDDNGQLSLYQCLELFTEPETLAPDEAWYCPQCKKHREASKQLSLWRLPHTLIVQLKRFSFRNFIWRDKIDKMVEFPIRGLNLTDAMGGHGADQPPAIYDLYGVVNHHGGILGGHYTSMARCADLTAPLRNEVGWRLFDDSRVTPVTSEKNAVTRSAYLLFYRRREPFIPEPSRCLGISADEEEEIEPIDAIKNEKVEAEDILSNKLYLDADSSEMEYSEEKFDPEKEDEMTDSLEEGQGRLVMNLDDKPPLLDYTDMDAVD